MSAADLNTRINAFAAHGWVLDRIVAGETALMMGVGSKDVFLLIFKMTVDIRLPLHAMIDGQQIGPLSAVQVRDYLAGGKINGDTPCWYPGMDEWLPLRLI